jgi:putative ABC transport system permease protein
MSLWQDIVFGFRMLRKQPGFTAIAALSLAGLLVGLGGSLFLTRLLSARLWGVSATDPATFATVAALLAVVAMLATLIPLRRAVRVDPTVALRYE